MRYKDHEIRIKETNSSIKVEVTIKGKDFGLIFGPKEKDKAIKTAKKTIDDLSPKESEVFKYLGGVIYIIKRKNYHVKGLCPSEAGSLIVELETKTKKEAKNQAKKKFNEILAITKKIIKERK